MPAMSTYKVTLMSILFPEDRDEVMKNIQELDGVLRTAFADASTKDVIKVAANPNCTSLADKLGRIEGVRQVMEYPY